MSDTAIRVEHLSKRYRLGQREPYKSLRDVIARTMASPTTWMRRKEAQATGNRLDYFWALDDVSFEVKQGEAVGIIGRNGAGKSTLLKILSRITKPTQGHAEIYGRVGSLLEVGTGFHPELTGRENIYLNGSILGMKRGEIERKFDEIVSFSEIEKFLDTPVKRYSSGMYVRLAFAVAAHLEPEILLVDEVLAVGDAEFQKKCLGRMGEVANQGRTVFFVSHNLVAIRTLCNLAIWLDGGMLKMIGNASEIVSAYTASFQSSIFERIWDDPVSAPGNDQVRLRLARAVAEDGTPMAAITIKTPLRLEFEYLNLRDFAEHSLTVNISDASGSLIFASDSCILVCKRGLVSGSCRIPPHLLNDGLYRVQLVISQAKSHWIYSHEDAIVLNINDMERSEGWVGKWPGVVRPKLEWHLYQSQ